MKEELAGCVLAGTVLDEGEILRICVREEHRQKGLGHALLRALFAACPGIRTWFLEVREGNRAAVRLYEAEGFTPTGVRKNYYRNPSENALNMRRALGD